MTGGYKPKEPTEYPWQAPEHATHWSSNSSIPNGPETFNSHPDIGDRYLAEKADALTTGNFRP